MRKVKLSTIYWGLFFIALGGVLLARNLGYLDFDFSLRLYWPVILIVLGLAWIIGSFEDRSSRKQNSA